MLCADYWIIRKNCTWLRKSPSNFNVGHHFEYNGYIKANQPSFATKIGFAALIVQWTFESPLLDCNFGNPQMKANRFLPRRRRAALGLRHLGAMRIRRDTAGHLHMKGSAAIEASLEIGQGKKGPLKD
jgi:hypothetical protein